MNEERPGDHILFAKEPAKHQINPTADSEKVDFGENVLQRSCDQAKRKRERRCFSTKLIIILGAIFYLLALSGLPGRAVTSISKFLGHDMNNHPSTDQRPLPGREIVIDNGSQSVEGRLPLYDLLHISTTSGSIDVIIDPQPAHPDHQDKPARLVIQSRSGSIKVIYSTSPAQSPSGQSTLPLRPYEVLVRGGSGVVEGRFVLSTEIGIYSQSGSIKATIVPVIHSDHVNGSLITDSTSGSQDITITEPIFPSDPRTEKGHQAATGDDYQASMNHAGQSGQYAKAHHASGSGSLKMIYPASWAGTVSANSRGSGSIKLEGRGLQETSRGRGHATAFRKPTQRDSEWWGSRGDMEVSLLTRFSGSIEFYADGLVDPTSF